LTVARVAGRIALVSVRAPRLLVAACAVLLALRSSAQRLALRTFGVGEGLASPSVNGAFEDRHGFLWIATWEGVSRFDGASFVNYGASDGLGVLLVNGVAEDEGGTLWAATNGAGVARFVELPNAPRRFEATRLSDQRADNAVNVIAFAGDGAMWCATDGGLFRGRRWGAGYAFECAVRDRDENPNSMRNACATRDGRVFASVDERIYVASGGELRQLPGPAGAEPPWFVSLSVDGDGRLIALDAQRMFVLDDPERAAGPDDWREVALALEPGEELRCTVSDADGVLWVGTSRGLLRLRELELTRFGARQGLPDSFVRSLALDRAGSLWIGTNGGGLARLIDRTLLTFGGGEREEPRVADTLVPADEGMVVVLATAGLIHVRGDAQVELEEFAVGGPSAAVRGLARGQRGTWWIGGQDGLFVASSRLPTLVGAERQHLAEPITVRPGVLVLDDGSAWVGTAAGRVYRASAGARPELALAGLPDDVTRLAIGPDGALWLAGNEWIARARGAQHERFGARHGLPEEFVRALSFDATGTRWVGLRNHGLARCVDPSAVEPRFEDATALARLRSATVWAICPARDGTLWLGTGRGLHAFVPNVGTVRVWTSADGLAGDVVRDVAFDAQGRLWAATTRGVTRFEPRSAPQVELAPTRIVSARAGGLALDVAGRGDSALSPEQLAADQRSVEIEFVSPHAPGQEQLVYQTLLSGGDEGWSAPSAMRSVRYARLAPGTYRFSVRATDLSGARHSALATLAFEIAPPLWRTPWFLAGALAAVALALWAWHRASVARALAAERVRRQIALDLHDDLGAGLAQIAIHSEVARRTAPPDVATRLERIAELGRALRTSMDDIVWSIDPRRDRADDLVQRMRATAHELAAELQVDFRAPEHLQAAGLELAPDRRRHVYLIFKEALTNAVRHAGARRVEVAIRFDGGELELRVADDGRGFERTAARAGRGLSNLERRAAQLGGRVAIESSPGRGTTITLRAAVRTPKAARRSVRGTGAPREPA
jgi:ligand-binding sensor domain-containing protein/two-component sensor histidine kinase